MYEKFYQQKSLLIRVAQKNLSIKAISDQNSSTGYLYKVLSAQRLRFKTIVQQQNAFHKKFYQHKPLLIRVTQKILSVQAIADQNSSTGYLDKVFSIMPEDLRIGPLFCKIIYDN